MAGIPVIYGEASWLRLVIPTMSASPNDKEIASYGAPDDIIHAIKASRTFVGATISTSSAKYHSTDIANGNKLSVPDVSFNRNAVDGSTISDDNADTSMPKFECSAVLTSALRTKIIAAFEAGVPVFATREVGKIADTGNSAGNETIFGLITDLKENPGKGPSTYDFTITANKFGSGQTFTLKATTGEMAAFNTASRGASKTLTPYVGSAITFLELTDEDWTNLGLGKVITK